MRRVAAICLLTLLSQSAVAKERTITLEVPTMNCAICPFTVKKALQNVEGVIRAEVTFETKLAVVTFDDKATTAKALTEATTNAGYPSIIKKETTDE